LRIEDNKQIKIIDPTLIKVGACLQVPTFKKVIYRRDRFGMTRVEKIQSVIDRQGYCLAGLLPRLINDNPEVASPFFPYSFPTYDFPPAIDNIEFREDQLRMIKNALLCSRGVLKAPPGSGKTVIAAGIISCYQKAQNCRVLFLTNTIDLCKQAVEEFCKFGFRTSCYFSGQKDIASKHKNIITAGTIQSVRAMPTESLCSYDIIIIDESHHACVYDGDYHRTLLRSTAPVRIGLTATPPKQGAEALVSEGLLGPIIDEISIQEGRTSDLIAQPKVYLAKIPFSENLRGLTKYSSIRKSGIVYNSVRTGIIARHCIKDAELGRSCLIYVSEIEHGFCIQEAIQKIDRTNSVGPVPFIWGDTPTEDRNKVRHSIESKEVKAVVASVVWKEGINIPSLDCVYIVGGGKSETAVIQSIGRGLRKSQNKGQLIIRDFIDSATVSQKKS